MSCLFHQFALADFKKSDTLFRENFSFFSWEMISFYEKKFKKISAEFFQNVYQNWKKVHRIHREPVHLFWKKVSVSDFILLYRNGRKGLRDYSLTSWTCTPMGVHVLCLQLPVFYKKTGQLTALKIQISWTHMKNFFWRFCK